MKSRAALMCGTALVAVTWFTPMYDGFPRVSGYVLQTSGTVYKAMTGVGRKDFIAVATVVFLVSITTWPTPGDCSGTLDSVECIGGGAGGRAGVAGCTAGGAGGGGGAYSKKLNLAVSGTITYQVGAAGGSSASGTDTWFKSTGDVLAKAGTVGANNTVVGPGGAAASGVGDTKNSGGNGATRQNAGVDGGGGGGAAGSHGDGVAATTTTGGNGDNGSGGSGGATNTVGNAGTEYDATHGSGGGGGGRSGGVGTGSAAGLYGGGGGGGRGTGQAGGVGKQGLIVITYTPVAAGVKQAQFLTSQAVQRASSW